MSKLKVSIVDKVTLRLEETGKVGDIIDLRELQSVDNSFILEAINNDSDITYKNLLKKEKEKYESDTNLKLLDQKSTLDKKYNDLVNDKLKVERDLEEARNSFNNEKKIALLEKDKQIEILNASIKSLKDNQDALINRSISDTKLNLSDSIKDKDMKITNLNNEITLLKEQLVNKDKLNEANNLNAINTIKNELQEEINNKDNEIAKLTYQKASVQTKVLGEELERWCNSEYQLYSLSGFENCKWYKDNAAIKEEGDIKGSKADYIFEVYSSTDMKEEDKLVGVCCEMKNESPETKIKTKNSDHYSKLDKDRSKKNCQYALLVSELEWDSNNDTPIRKIQGYENMYMVRPTYFVTFLSLIKSLSIKYQDLLKERKREDENFKESQEIIDEFESFKNTYLDKPLNSVIDSVNKIKDQAIKAREASDKIVIYSSDLLNTKLEEIKIKIDRFDIRKIGRKVENIG